MPTKSEIYWLFGNSGAGKTTLAKQLQQHLPHSLLLDGDDLRTVWQLGFSKEDRYEQNIRAARLAAIAAKQGITVIVALICPYRELRAQISQQINPQWIYLPGGHPTTDEYPFEEPAGEALVLKPIPGAGNLERVVQLIAPHTAYAQ